MNEDLNTSPPEIKELTNEINTGYSFEGKPVYEKTIKFTSPSNNTRTDIPCSILSSVDIISFTGYINNGALLDLNYNDDATFCCTYLKPTGYISIMINNQYAYNCPCIITIRYIKKDNV